MALEFGVRTVPSAVSAGTAAAAASRACASSNARLQPRDLGLPAESAPTARFPKLARHLGFRESEEGSNHLTLAAESHVWQPREDQEPLPTVWQREATLTSRTEVISSRLRYLQLANN